MNRRHWIQVAGLSLLGSGLTVNRALSKEMKLEYNPDKLGIISGTLKNEMKQDWKGTLQKLADLGYRYLEGGSPEGVDPTQFARVVRDAGLLSVGIGGAMAGLQKGLDDVLRQAEILESEYIVCYWPWLSSATDLTRGETLQAAENLNEMGRRVKDAGFKFAWHNHDKEFVEVEGGRVFDMLMNETDPAVVGVELDWYWVVKGGADPVKIFNRYPGRFPLAHVKDMNNNTDLGITCVGHGIIDFAPIIKAAPTGGTRHLIVENERAVKGLACANVSIRHLKELLS